MATIKSMAINKKTVIIAIIILAILIWGAVSLKKANAPSDLISPELGYAGFSPKGPSGGAIIPASCESGYSHFFGECASSGFTGFGPFTPQRELCFSAPNSCGLTNPGMRSVGGVCPVPPPDDSACQAPSLSIGSVTSISGNAGSFTITTPLSSQTVNKGQRCTIYWDANPATRCTIIGPGMSTSGGAKGVVQTPPITSTSVFNIRCYNGNVISSSKNFTCRLNPRFQEVL